jgi:hypothetical protein
VPYTREELDKIGLWSAFSLAYKYYTRLEVTDSENTSAYYNTAIVMAVKRLIVLAPGLTIALHYHPDLPVKIFHGCHIECNHLDLPNNAI